MSGAGDRSIRALLTGGDRRSIGRVPRVLVMLERTPAAIGQLVRLMGDRDPVVAMRSADALEKATRSRPELLRPHRRSILGLLRRARQQEVRWHLAQIVPRLALTPAQRRAALQDFDLYLEDRSAIVRTFAMQALADLAGADPLLRRRVRLRIESLTAAGTPAMAARGRRLLAALRHDSTLPGRHP